MKRSVVRTCLAALALGLLSPASVAAVWSDVTKIVNVTAIDGVKVLRLEISPNVNQNPGNCDVTVGVIDIQLEADGSSETQRLLLNAVQLAFLTGRNVRFYLREDRCSTADAALRLRVATGVQVLN